jgi:hypothetical protein
MITMHFKSVEHEKYPVKSKIIRGETIISGYIFEEDTGNGNNNIKLTIIS